MYTMSLLDRGENTVPGNCRRLVLLGSSRVGKSAIVSRFLYDKFDDKYTPTVENFHRKIYRIRGVTYRLDLLDTSSHHPFPAMRRLSYLTGDMFLLVYDVCDRASFEETKQTLQHLDESCSLGEPGSSYTNPVPPPFILVGNKCDLISDREVHSAEGLTTIADRPCCDFFETSAMCNINISELFSRLFELVNLPPEMSPARHRKVTPSYCGTDRREGFAGCINRKISEATGVVHPNARRPSVHTDLLVAEMRRSLLVVDPQETRLNKKNAKICVLQ